MQADSLLDLYAEHIKRIDTMLGEHQKNEIQADVDAIFKSVRWTSAEMVTIVVLYGGLVAVCTISIWNGFAVGIMTTALMLTLLVGVLFLALRKALVVRSWLKFKERQTEKLGQIERYVLEEMKKAVLELGRLSAAERRHNDDRKGN